MLKVFKDQPFKTERGVLLEGYAVGFDHFMWSSIQPAGLGGGFLREKDAQIAEKSVRDHWPDFPWDTCTPREMEVLYRQEGADKFWKVLTENLQW